MLTNKLTEDLITFGKYKDKTIQDVIRDRKYCKWLLEQDWFENGYTYLYGIVASYNPHDFLLRKTINNDINAENFTDEYKYFRLKELHEIDFPFNEVESVCYKFYRTQVMKLHSKILEKIQASASNIFDIKAPVKWLQEFETECKMSRDELKGFMSAFDLPNLTVIMEDIKAMGNLTYKGGKTFSIAMKNSREQEQFWNELLRPKFGEKLCSQFKYNDCIFDFLNISSGTLYECKLSLKDFNEDQYNKYLKALDKYKIIYLIDRDCIVNISEKIIYTTNSYKYIMYQCDIPLKKIQTKFDDMIMDYEVVEVIDLTIYL